MELQSRKTDKGVNLKENDLSICNSIEACLIEALTTTISIRVDLLHLYKVLGAHY